MSRPLPNRALQRMWSSLALGTTPLNASIVGQTPRERGSIENEIASTMSSGGQLERLLVFAIAWIWVSLPCIPIVAAWRALHRSTLGRFEVVAFLSIVTISYCWILLGVFSRQTIGPDYSSLRSEIILANMVAMISLSVWAAVRGREFRRRLLIVSLVTGSVWFYVLAISSVV